MQQPISPQQDFKAVQFIHLALVVGVVLMIAMMSFLIEDEAPLSLQRVLGDTFGQIACGLVALSIPLSFMMWSQRKSLAPTQGSLAEKLNHFRSSSILRWALLEGPSLAAIVFAFVSNNKSILLPACIGALALAISKPIHSQMEDDFHIS